jgi:hypothetical protein
MFYLFAIQGKEEMNDSPTSAARSIRGHMDGDKIRELVALLKGGENE